MSVVRLPPEFADRGYWYVVPTTEGGDGVTRPVGVGKDWCAWYGTVDGVNYAAVRLPDPVLIPQAVNIPVGAVLASESGKPFGRVGGR